MSSNDYNGSSSQLPNCSLSWTQNGRSEQRIKPSATLDLHGFNREGAIRELTLFLERNGKHDNQRPSWVCVITGTGSHSGSLGGPVLKTAVHRLLEKRHMEYCYARKKGSFFVNAQSGIELRANPTLEEQQLAAAIAGGTAAVPQDPLFQDTKVRLVQQPQQPTPPSLPKSNTATLGKKLRRALPHQFAAAAAGTSEQHSNSSTAPSLTELKEEEALLQQAKTHSLQETRQWKSQRDKEEHELQQILRQTQQEALQEERREQEELRKAMALSQKEQVKEACVETHHEQELERVLQLSLQEQQYQNAAWEEENEEEEVLQKVISESNLEHMQQQQEEEEALEQALRMSMVAAQEKTTVPREKEEEDEELQRVLRLSMMEASAFDNVHANTQWQEELQAHSQELQDIIEDPNTKPQAVPSSEWERGENGFQYEHSGKVPEAERCQAKSTITLSRPRDQTKLLSSSLNDVQSQQQLHNTQHSYLSNKRLSQPLVENVPTGEALLESILYKSPTTVLSDASHDYEPASKSGTGIPQEHLQQQQPQEESSDNDELEPSTDEQLAQMLLRSMGSPIESEATNRL